MIKIEIDNPEMEAVFKDLANGLLGFLKETMKPKEPAVKLKPLDPPVEVPPKLLPPMVVTHLDPEIEQKELAFESRKSNNIVTSKYRTNHKHVEKCEEGFPMAWKKKVHTLISVKKPFTVAEVIDGSNNWAFRQSLYDYLLGLKSCIYTKAGNQNIVIPIWEENGVTKWDNDVYKMKGEFMHQLKHPEELKRLKLAPHQRAQFQKIGYDQYLKQG